MALDINKIYNMDCLEGMKLLDDNSVDLVLTDPPYNLNKPFENDNLEEDEFIKFLVPILNEFGRVIKPKHSIIVYFDSGKKLPLLFKSLFKTNLYFQRCCTLYKPNDCSMPHNRIIRKSELFLILSKTQELHHDGDKYIHDVLIGNHTKKENWYHPTAKNQKINNEILLAHTKEKDLVLDAFMGSGTTAVSALKYHRRFIGFEIDPNYCEIANKRIKPYLNQTRLTTFKNTLNLST